MRLTFSLLFLISFLCSGLLCFSQNVHFTKVTPPKDDPEYTVLGMAQDIQGNLWLATSNGLYKYDGYQYNAYHNEPFNSNSPAAAKIEYVMADKAGYIWLAPYHFGLDRLDPEHLSQVSVKAVRASARRNQSNAT